MILALLSIGVASAGDLSSLNTTDAQDSVSVYDESNMNLNTDDTTVLEYDNSNVISSKEDVDSQSQSNSNVIKEFNNVKNFTNLQEEINAKSDNSVLDLDCNYTYNGKSNFHGISIHKNNFTIDGHGHTIDTNNRVNIFNVGWGNITLKNLILINTYTKDARAAVDITNNPYGVVYISNCTFINNHANYDSYSLGGAINDGECGGLIISNCSFVNNTAYQVVQFILF